MGCEVPAAGTLEEVADDGSRLRRWGVAAAGMGKRLGAVKSIAGVTTDPVSVRHRILDELGSLGRLTNVEVRAMLGVSRLEAARIMQRLRDEGKVRLVGQGRGAHWVPEKKK